MRQELGLDAAGGFGGLLGDAALDQLALDAPLFERVAVFWRQGKGEDTVFSAHWQSPATATFYARGSASELLRGRKVEWSRNGV
jgi:hypothetical protein